MEIDQAIRFVSQTADLARECAAKGGGVQIALSAPADEWVSFADNMEDVAEHLARLRDLLD